MQVGFIGSGNMAAALARGWGEPVLCSDSGSGRARALAEELGGEAVTNPEVARRADVVILAHKPAQLADVAAKIAGTAKAVVSILAGKTQADLRAAYPGTPVFRLEPNTPAEVGRGVLAFAEPDEPVDEEPGAAVRERFARLGVVVEVPERLMGVAGACAGVAPAYWALLVEAWVDAAVRRGMPAATAQELVIGGMAGTAELLRRYEGDTLTVRRAVASPRSSAAACAPRSRRRWTRWRRTDGGPPGDRRLRRGADLRLHDLHRGVDRRLVRVLARRPRALQPRPQRGARLPARRLRAVPAHLPPPPAAPGADRLQPDRGDPRAADRRRHRRRAHRSVTTARPVLRAAALAVAVLAADQASKALVRGSIGRTERVDVLPGLDLVNTRNTGVAFGFFSGGGAVVAGVAALALVALLAFFATHLARPLVWLPTGLLVGGAAGNLIDRAREGAVTDFVDLPLWPAFNVADAAITIGVLALLYVLEGPPSRGPARPD